jgi:hypothetical protein
VVGRSRLAAANKAAARGRSMPREKGEEENREEMRKKGLCDGLSLD